MLRLSDHVIPNAMPLAIDLFVELSNQYTRASDSLLPSTMYKPGADFSAMPNALKAQARLLSSILDKLRSSRAAPVQGASESPGVGSISAKEQPVLQSVTDWSAHQKNQHAFTSMFPPLGNGIDT